MTTEQTGRRSSLAFGAAVNLVGGGLGAVVNLVLAALVGRYLGAEGAGVYFLVVAAFVILANTAELGADTGLVRFVSAARAVGTPEQVPALVRMAVRPVLAGAVGITAVGVAWMLLAPPVDGVSPLVLALCVPVALCLSGTALMLAVTRGFGDPITFPLLQNVVLPLGRLGGVALAVLLGWSLEALLLGWLAPVPIVLVVATAIAMRLVARSRATSAAPAGDVARPFWRFSAARGVTASIEILLEWVDVIIVGALAGPAEAGVYAVVTRCVRAGEVVQQAARIVMGPAVSAALARGERERAGEIYGVVTAAMVWLSWPFFALLAVFADAVLGLFGADFRTGAIPLAVLAAAMAFATAAGAVQTVLLMGGRSSWQLADKSGALALNVVLNLLLVPTFGITGAAVAWAVTIVVDTVVVTAQVQGAMGVRPPVGPIALAAGLALVGVLLPALVLREQLGSSLAVLAGCAAGLAVVHLALGWLLRERLGLRRLIALRSA